MRAISIKEMPYAQNRESIPIKELTLDRDYIYIESQYGELWRVWLEYDFPRIEKLK